MFIIHPSEKQIMIDTVHRSHQASLTVNFVVYLTQCRNDNYKMIDISIKCKYLSFPMVYVILSIIIFFQ